MNETLEKLNDSKMKSSSLKFIISALVILFLIFASLVFSFFNWENKPDPANEKTIRKFAAAKLKKDPNNLTDEDIAKIEELSFSISRRAQDYYSDRLYDVKLLSKFTNLQKLDLGDICPPENEIPKWMEILSKLGIYDLDKRFEFDLSPLKKLHNLEELSFGGESIKNIKPLASLNNLKILNLRGVPVSDIKPLKNLTKLQRLYIQHTQVTNLKPLKNLMNLTELEFNGSPVSNLEPIQELKNLQQLSLQRTQVTDLECLRGLTDLRRLDLNNTPVSNLELIKGLKKMEFLNLVECKNITTAQVEDLQKVLPNLEIAWK
jgi:internalin A